MNDVKIANQMDWRGEREIGFAAGLAVLTGIVAFCAASVGFFGAAFYFGVQKIVIFSSDPAPSSWVTPAILALSFLIAVLMGRLVYRVVFKNVKSHRGRLLRTGGR